jgi:hypothetical protein
MASGLWRRFLPFVGALTRGETEMKTIAKNRVEKFAPRIRNIRSYTLENGFTGQPVPDEKRSIDFAINTGAKFSFDPETMTGKARHHSNSWFEFDVAELIKERQ